MINRPTVLVCFEDVIQDTWRAMNKFHEDIYGSRLTLPYQATHSQRHNFLTTENDAKIAHKTVEEFIAEKQKEFKASVYSKDISPVSKAFSVFNLLNIYQDLKVLVEGDEYRKEEVRIWLNRNMPGIFTGVTLNSIEGTVQSAKDTCKLHGAKGIIGIEYGYLMECPGDGIRTFILRRGWNLPDGFVLNKDTLESMGFGMGESLISTYKSFGPYLK